MITIDGCAGVIVYLSQRCGVFWFRIFPHPLLRPTPRRHTGACLTLPTTCVPFIRIHSPIACPRKSILPAFLTTNCLAVDDDISIITSKSSELNIVLPAKTEQDDPVEIPVPEQVSPPSPFPSSTLVKRRLER